MTLKNVNGENYEHYEITQQMELTTLILNTVLCFHYKVILELHRPIYLIALHFFTVYELSGGRLQRLW